MMEQQSPTESLFELQVDFESGNYFKETARWSKFIAIICFIGIGLLTLSLLLAGQEMVKAFSTMANQNSGGEYTGNVSESIIVGVVAIGLVIFAVVTIFLYRFATMVRQGIEKQDQHIFNKGLKNLKYYFVVMGIFTILSVLYTFYKTIKDLL